MINGTLITKCGIQIDSETGIVTIDYQIVQNYKELLVSSTFGNSDESESIHFIIPKFKRNSV